MVPAATFARTIGINYAGAETAESSLKSLRVFQASGTTPPVEVLPPASPRSYWSRHGIALWLVEQLSQDVPTLVGINHGFSFPLRYFEVHGLAPDWPAFLDDFQRHWPTDGQHNYVDTIREGSHGHAAARLGRPGWLRLTDERSGFRNRSVFQFTGRGAIGKLTHAGLPWLRVIRQQPGPKVHVWPFDGWVIPPGQSALVEVAPAICTRGIARGLHDPAQHCAFSIALWLAREGAAWLHPPLTPAERTVAQVEGWILGVPGR